ncbi:MAG: lipopolysaccharide biosynthesis protein RfbH [Magnetococcales bacterium]|nr:lipopolysaccharide biosynthesis protein RfbH [Magnetococcales bacterium]
MENVSASPDELKQQILDRVARFAEMAHAPRPFVPGETPVPVSGKVYGAPEMVSLVEAALEFWLTAGRFDAAFCEGLKQVTQRRHVLTANSGSSANLLALTSLTSPLLGKRRLLPGDEVITLAAGFPTTVNPILQNRLLPVFVDVQAETYNVDLQALADAVTDKTRAIMMAHTLGNPFDLDGVMEIAKKHHLWLIEDTCDALGSFYRGKPAGSFGDVASLSFYPAHHITTGEGGAVLTDNSLIKRSVESFRDWGRDCWCPTGRDNTCKQRFERTFPNLPPGYDHKYVYSHIGYNLKMTDLQAAVGLAQLQRLPELEAARKANFAHLHAAFAQWSHLFILPRATPHAEPSWFGFPLTVKDEAPFTREELMVALNERKIGTRLLFAGNLTKQPLMQDQPCRISGSLENTDRILRGTFWLGVFPGLSRDMLDYVVAGVEAFLARRGLA